jgi:hypothetical protein
MAPGLIIGNVVLAVVALSVVITNVMMRRRGYSIPGTTIARCSKGHLFTTRWIEGVSLKAVRLGPRTRYQHCAVGDHWAIVHPVKADELTEAGPSCHGRFENPPQRGWEGPSKGCPSHFRPRIVLVGGRIAVWWAIFR